MDSPSSSRDVQRVYRVDKFRVPEAARNEFLERVLSIHEFLRAQPGYGPGTARR